MNINAKTSSMANVLGGGFTKSFRGVPIIVMKFQSNRYLHSFCYMGKRRLWRGFYPYTPKGGGWNDTKQVKKDFETDQELIDFVKTKKEMI